MEQLIEMVLQALRAAGIHCVRALDEETLPRLKAPMVAVGADPSACRQHALARYLGQDADGAERYGMGAAGDAAAGGLFARQTGGRAV